MRPTPSVICGVRCAYGSLKSAVSKDLLRHGVELWAQRHPVSPPPPPVSPSPRLLHNGCQEKAPSTPIRPTAGSCPPRAARKTSSTRKSRKPDYASLLRKWHAGVASRGLGVADIKAARRLYEEKEDGVIKLPAYIYKEKALWAGLVGGS